jgi:hypothetical protein
MIVSRVAPILMASVSEMPLPLQPRKRTRRLGEAGERPIRKARSGWPNETPRQARRAASRVGQTVCTVIVSFPIQTTATSLHPKGCVADVAVEWSLLHFQCSAATLQNVAASTVHLLRLPAWPRSILFVPAEAAGATCSLLRSVP